jgi:hypothetical protein
MATAATRRPHSIDRRVAFRLAVPLGVGVAIIWAQTWHGPTILAFTPSHGVDAGDLLAIPFLVLSVAVARRGLARSATGGIALTACGLALGVLLLLAGVIPGQGGPLVPAGGSTLDGTIRQTFAKAAVSPDRWTNVAFVYDGDTERLYVDGSVVATHAARGRVQVSGNPLWIGGNRPYGEHFEGLIDEVRVYDRALPAREIRRGMTTRVHADRGLVAAYGFDAASGTDATDSSGNGNEGTILGATHVRGRFGRALSFDGRRAVVRVPPSASLNPTRALTLSAWIKPFARDSGWRAIVQRQADAYFLSAGSGRRDSRGLQDTLRIVLIVAAGAWFCVAVATGRAPTTALRRRTWWLAPLLFAVGSVADAALAPSGTLCGCVLVALWLALTGRRRLECAGFALVAVVCALVTLVCVADIDDARLALARNDGATARTVTLGAVFVLAVLLPRVAQPRRPTRV